MTLRAESYLENHTSLPEAGCRQQLLTNLSKMMCVYCHLVIIFKLNHCCEYTTVVNSRILIHKTEVDDHKVTDANPQHGSIEGFNNKLNILSN